MCPPFHFPVLFRDGRKGLPLSGRRERFQVLIGMPAYPGEGSPNDPEQVQQRLFIDLIAIEEIQVVAKVTKEPVEFPEGTFAAVNPARKRSRLRGCRLQDCEAQSQEGLLWMPAIGCSFHTNQEETFQIAAGTLLFRVQARNASSHNFTSTGCA